MAQTCFARHYRTGECKCFILDGGRVEETAQGASGTTWLYGPGFFDLQCNGFAGVDFNSPDHTDDELLEAVRAMQRYGVTHVLPTFITAEPARLEYLLRRFARLRSSYPEFGESVPGFHLEGPFINSMEGARGAHPLAAIRAVDPDLWRCWQSAAGQAIRLVTLAPEVEGGLDHIARLRKERVVPALGHTMADAKLVREAVSRGALLSTHLGNGCPQTMHRHLNPIYAQLGCDELAASLIADGVHLPAETLHALVRAKEPSRVIAITDAMAAAGALPGTYKIGDLQVEAGADGVVRNPGSPNFAGSSLTMDQAVRRLILFGEMTLAEAWDAASINAWALLHQANPDIQTGSSQTLASWEEGLFTIQATILNGRALWHREPFGL